LKTANKITLQQHFYYEIRERFDLSAQMASICIGCGSFRTTAIPQKTEDFAEFSNC
jgi:hypothetical protein